ncbi:MAG: methyltransferase domain-containing protein [Thermoplasmata archaeon]
MPWKYTEEYYREYTRTTWNESAEAYLTLLGNLEPFRADLIQRLRVRTGEKVLDLGTGPGEPALTIAERVGAPGRVIGVDLSEKMISIAQRVASARSISNAEFRVMDCSALEFGDNLFDGAISSFGFQIFTDPEKAARETLRVLRPNGRVAVSVWSTGDRVPWIHAVVGPMLKHAEPDETGYIPTPYELGAPGDMVRFLEAAGFREAREGRSTHSMRWGNEEEYLQSILKATPIGHSLSEETPEVQQDVLREARSNLEQWRTEEGLSIPSECVFVTATK